MKIIILGLLVVLMTASGADAQESQPVVTDSRIKTFVYNEYDVYNIYTHYGYQTNIEFGLDEEIVTVSVGDRIGWQIVPVGRRLFIRPMEEDVSTNMTVITSERTYQFDLNSSGSGKLKPAEELAYVIRFYYPDDDARLRMDRPPQAAEMREMASPPSVSYNYHYTFSGPDPLAPLKVFDNGTETYFKLQPQGGVPLFFIEGSDGKEYPVKPMPSHDGLLAVSGVATKFILRYGEKDTVYIYNEGI